MGRRSGRAAARRAAAALESTPKHYQTMDEDEPMADAAPEAEPSKDNEDEEEDPAHEPEAEDDDDENKSGGDEDEDDEQPAEEAEDDEEEAAKSPSPPPVQTVRRKRLGRPPKNRPPDWDNMIEVPVREGEQNTPRRRGRGGWRGRGGRKGASLAPTQQAIDKEGTMMDIINDEVALPEDPEGETKVDKNGNLQGGREYRCRTFTVAGRGDRLYMLSTEPARCVGFRDSYLFFTKHLRLTKVIVDDEEKRDMIEREIIPHSYKGRSIGIVTARSVFREFGALIIVGGRRIIDDYEVGKARMDGVVEGELADPNDHFVVGEPYNKNQYVAWHGASSVYHSAAPVVAQQTGVFVAPKKRRVAVNDTNWMYEHAKEASNFNSILTGMRQANLHGVYDMHTNMMHYPATMQPTHARIEVVPLEQQQQHEQPREQDNDSASTSSIFKPLPSTVPRNFRVVDTVLETPPSGIAPSSYDRRFFIDGDRAGGGGSSSTRDRGSTDFLAPFRGLSAVSDEIRDLLPAECRAAFDQAQQRERDWHSKWGPEKDAACRRDPVIDKAIVPMVKMV
ncbi:chromatin structure-remodeling complex protein RSC7 [Pyricularia oryzae 70-15]|uniref:Chromatin structure-remodeling complex protein RSC7 n=3 Tax=Pyricularia oryzae TaxID=318829 RepID=G4MKY0_PYRO7|nr:chromatin structure-remodeling complex protein RSC7 [Pyricularia oryzae 70-15]EHA57615.1 chromatin structure-remodeling complex protein RSC7 [Pyricularia oryzae 70-15]KAI7925434.1 chromatin structure-remodeling complex protein RSC7 [Pyricularia oryzae]KAI7925641.1 chromatin structure-remodeling complex protein RSC7 [Pyricularia oryzae]